MKHPSSHHGSAPPIVADKSLLFRLWIRRRRRVAFSGGSLRVDGVGGALIQGAAVDSLEDGLRWCRVWSVGEVRYLGVA